MKPVLQALLVADRVYQDKDTGKKILAGVFRNLSFMSKKEFDELTKRQGSIPIFSGGYSAGSPFAYASLTEVRGEQPFVLRYVNLKEDKALFEYQIPVKCDDPLEVVELVVPLPKLPATEPGIFALELLWHEEPLGSFRITVQEMKTREDGHVE